MQVSILRISLENEFICKADNIIRLWEAPAATNLMGSGKTASCRQPGISESRELRCLFHLAFSLLDVEVVVSPGMMLSAGSESSGWYVERRHFKLHCQSRVEEKCLKIKYKKKNKKKWSIERES